MLKHAAAAFLREHGCRAVAAEVSCPFARYRVDVAGYADTPGPRSDGLERRTGTARRLPARTIFIECKASRSDFRRDAGARAELEQLQAHLKGVECMLRTRQLEPVAGAAVSASVPGPGFALGEPTLFTALTQAEDRLLRCRSYRQVLRRLRAVERQLHGETKFVTLTRYRLADRLYVAAPKGLLMPRELPDGWGLLEAPPALLADGDPNADLFGQSVLSVRVRARPLESREAYRQRVLRNIAVAASAVAVRSMGVRA